MSKSPTPSSKGPSRVSSTPRSMRAQRTCGEANATRRGRRPKRTATRLPLAALVPQPRFDHGMRLRRVAEQRLSGRRSDLNDDLVGVAEIERTLFAVLFGLEGYASFPQTPLPGLQSPLVRRGESEMR